MTHSNTAADAAAGKAIDAARGNDGYSRRRASGRRDPAWVHRNFAELNGTERMVLSLQLMGLKHQQIAERLHKHENHMAKICRYRRYREAFEQKLSEVDEAAVRENYLRLKPQVLRAVEDGLNSDDPNIALRAAELWFRTMGPEAFRRGAVRPAPSAEDIAVAILARREAVQAPPLLGAELRY